MRPVSHYLQALSRSIEQVRTATASKDDETLWAATSDSLAWLYRAEERLRKEQSDYYKTRLNSENGRVLAGLIYFRGEAEHASTTDPYTIGLVGAPILVWTEDGLKSVQPLVWNGSDLQPSDLFVATAVFPDLHDDARPDQAHGRDNLYRTLVAGRSVVRSLEYAQAFLATFGD